MPDGLAACFWRCCFFCLKIGLRSWRKFIQLFVWYANYPDPNYLSGRFKMYWTLPTGSREFVHQECSLTRLPSASFLLLTISVPKWGIEGGVQRLSRSSPDGAWNLKGGEDLSDIDAAFVFFCHRIFDEMSIKVILTKRNQLNDCRAKALPTSFHTLSTQGHRVPKVLGAEWEANPQNVGHSICLGHPWLQWSWKVAPDACWLHIHLGPVQDWSPEKKLDPLVLSDGSCFLEHFFFGVGRSY